MKKTLLLIAAVIAVSASFAQIGGPDAFGYTYVTSDTNFVQFNWEEADTLNGGTYSTATQFDDGEEDGILIGFTFPFYGAGYDTLNIGSNGQINFVNNGFASSLSNNCLPEDPGYDFMGQDTAFIASVWCDLNPSSGSGTDPSFITYKSFPDHFIVEYQNVKKYGGSDGDTWQVALYANGDIKINFLETSAIQSDQNSTTGIQGSTIAGLDYICNTVGDTIHDSLTVWFINPTNTGITTNKTESLIIYPNPSNGQFTIGNISNNNFDIKIIDYQGRMVYNNSFNNINNQVNIDLSGFAKGIYLLQFQTTEGITTKQIVVE